MASPSAELFEQHRSKLLDLDDRLRRAIETRAFLDLPIAHSDHDWFAEAFPDLVDVFPFGLEEMRQMVQESIESIKEHTVVVRGDRSWQRTGLEVGEGEIVVVATEGRWRSGDRGMVGAEGDGYSPYGLLRQAPTGALIGRTSGSTTMYAAYRAFRPDAPGELLLRMNDFRSIGSSGTLTVTLWAIKPLPRGEPR